MNKKVRCPLIFCVDMVNRNFNVNLALWGSLILVLILPPLLRKDIYLIINNDTIAHLAMFESIKEGYNPQFLYLGQEVVGVALVWLERLVKVDLATLFMWFNYLSLFMAGVVSSILVKTITKNTLASSITAWLIIFGIGATMHLFYSGSIFNVIELLFIFPLLLIMVYQGVENGLKWLWLIIPTSFILFVFHPSFGNGITMGNNLLGITPEPVLNMVEGVILFIGLGMSLLFLISLALLYKHKVVVNTGAKVVLVLLGLGLVATVTLSITGLTGFSSRMLMNMSLMFGILAVILFGMAWSTTKEKSIRAVLVGFVVVGILPNLINWLSLPNYGG